MKLNDALAGTNFNFPGQQSFYKGKVRDVYSFEIIKFQHLGNHPNELV